VSFALCQSQPSSSTTSLTLRAFFPICSVAQRDARSVSAMPGAPMRRSSSV
jgi:hypothetical protein